MKFFTRAFVMFITFLYLFINVFLMVVVILLDLMSKLFGLALPYTIATRIIYFGEIEFPQIFRNIIYSITGADIDKDNAPESP